MMSFNNRLSLVFVTALFLVAGSAIALPGGIPSDIGIGSSYDVVVKSLGMSKNKFDIMDFRTPQQYARGLVRSDMLVMLNRAGARTGLVYNEKGKTTDIKFVSVSSGKLLYTMGFANGKLDAVMMKVSVPVDTAVGGAENQFTANRLGNISGYLDSLSSCSLNPLDPRARNHFAWKGNCPGSAKVYVEYLPDIDQYWVLFH